MSSVALALIFAAFVVVIAGVVMGLLTFSPSRAAAVVHAEQLSPQQVQQVSAHLRRRRPVTPQPPRLDRHDAYVWLLAGLCSVGLGVVLAPAPTGVLTELSWDAQTALGTCILVGSTVALIGTTLGLGPVARPISENLLADLIGDDVRVPYTFGWLGLMSVGVGMAGYAWAIYQYATLIGTLGGGLTFAIGGLCVTQGFKFISRIRAYVRERNLLLAKIATRIQDDQ